MFRVHRDERDEAQLEPRPGLCSEHRSVMAPWTYSGFLIPFWLDFCGAAEDDWETEEEIHGGVGSEWKL